MHCRASMKSVGAVGTLAVSAAMFMGLAQTAGLAETARQLPVDAPNARQIVPIVAAYHRPAGVKLLAPKPPASVGPVAATPAKAGPAEPIARRPAGVAANPALHGALARATTVAITCKAGQRYSATRRICFTPGVTSVASAGHSGPYVGSVRRVRAAQAADPAAPRSALGIAPK